MSRRLLLIGWDAADWKVISRLVDEGKMPNLERLISRGVMANLATMYPALSPMLWTSIATGKHAWKHGVHGFAEPTPDGKGVRPISGTSRTTKAVWNILNQQNYKCHVVGWWPSNPVDQLDGVTVSNLYQKPPENLSDPWPMLPGTVHPPELRKTLAGLRVHPHEFDGDTLLPFVPNAESIDQQSDRRLLSVAKILAECSSVHAAATHVMQTEPWDFMAVYHDAIDHFCHGFMKYHPPRLDWIDENDFEMYKDVVTTAYRFHDMMLGSMLDLIDDQTTVMLISDHGFHSDHLRPRQFSNQPAGPADEHRDHGIFVAAGPGIKQDELVFGAGLLDIAPTILSAYGLPVGRDMDGQVLKTVFEDSPDVSFVDSWDNIEGNDGRTIAIESNDSVSERETLKQLADLGYIDQPDSGQENTVDKTVRELRFNLAQAYRGGDRLPEALEILEELWERWPFEHRFGVQMFDILLKMKKTNRARTVLDLILKRKEQQIPLAQKELDELIEELEEAELDGEAEAKSAKRANGKKLTKLKRQAKNNPRTIAWLEGRLLAAEGRHVEAIARLESARGVQTTNRSSLILAIADSYLALRKWEKADATYREVIKLDPTNSTARLGIAQAALPRRQYKTTLKQSLASIGLLYHRPRAHYLCALALDKLGRPDKAAKTLAIALQQRPNFPKAHALMSRLYSRSLDRPDLAAQHATKAVEAKRRRIAHRFEGKPANNKPLDPARVAGLGSLGAATKNVINPMSAIVVVSGLPRSGTSMMMQMLEAGGMDLMVDDHRPADLNNVNGYQEFDPVKSLMKNNTWLNTARNRAVKVVAPLIPHLDAALTYRIVFMERPLTEVIASQKRMLKKLGKRGASLSETRLAAVFEQHVAAARQFIESNPQVTALSVDYGTVLTNPKFAAEQVSQFLNLDFDIEAMERAVNPLLRTQTADAASANLLASSASE